MAVESPGVGAREGSREDDDARVIARSRDEPEQFAALFVADRAVARAGATGVRRELAAALAKLSARHRNVVLLVAWGDLGYEEVAQALGVPSEGIAGIRRLLHLQPEDLRIPRLP